MMMFPAAIMAIESDDDRAFMERVYLDYRKLMYHVAYGILREHYSTEDVINSSCEALCNKISLLRSFDTCKLKAYVVLTCRNTALNALKLKNRQNARLFCDFDIVSETVAGDEDASEHILRDAEIAELTDGLNRLEPKERDILQLRYLMQKSDNEIAALYGIKSGSVRYYLTLARRHLALILKGTESE